MEPVIQSSANRNLLHIQTDKVVYRPGDTVYIQAYIFEALNKTPAYSGNLDSYQLDPSYLQYYSEPSQYVSMTIFNPLNEQTYSSSASSSNSTCSFTYQIPEDAVGGEYQVRMSSQGIPESIRVFRIRQYERQELTIQSQFDSSVYKPGDQVTAQLVIKPADGSSFQNGNVPSYSVVVSFDRDQQFTQELAQTDQNGQAQIQFQIPSNYSLGFLSVVVTAFYRQVVQGYTATLTVVQPQDIYIEFFPETFNYVYNVPNKVYFQAYTSNKSDALYVDIQDASLVFESGIIFDENQNPSSSAGVELAGISTYHEGRGNFSFQPVRNVTYYLSFSLGNQSYQQYLNVSEQPNIENLELNFAIDNKVLENKENLVVKIQTNDKLDSKNIYVLGVFNKEDILYLREVKLLPNNSQVFNIDAKDFELFNGGVLRIAVFQVINPLIWYDRYDINVDNTSTRTGLPNPFYDVYFIPKGELLFFKNPAQHLNVNIMVPEKIYQPGDYVEFEVEVVDAETGKPVGFDSNNRTLRSFVSVTVTDESVFSQVENRKQPPSLPAMVLLEDEIQLIDNQFFNSDDYIDYIYQDNNDSSPNSIDQAPNATVSNRNTELLLGVQGWRYGYFYPQVMQKWSSVIQKMNQTEVNQLQSLMAYVLSYTYTPQTFEMNASVGSGAAAGFDMAEAAPSPSSSAGSSGGSTAAPQNQNQQEGQSQDQSNNDVSSQTLSKRELEFWELIKKIQNCEFEQNTRLYTHAQRFSFFAEESSRFDTVETVFYSASSMTDNQGRYKVRFYLSDLITSFRISATAFDTIGRLGYAKQILVSQKDFYISFQLPQQITLGDNLLIPVYINNNYPENTVATLQINTFDNNLTATFQSNNQSNALITAQANNQTVVYMRINANNLSENVYIQIKASSRSPFNNNRVVDSIFRDTTIVSPGVIQYQSEVGLVGPDQPASVNFNIPTSMVATTQNFVAEVYPSTVDALIQALLQIIIGQPGPCFVCIYTPLYANLLLASAQQKGVNVQNANGMDFMTQYQDLTQKILQFVNSDGSIAQFSGSAPDPFLSIVFLLTENQYNDTFDLLTETNYIPLTDYLLSLRSSQGLYDQLAIPYKQYPDYIYEAFVVYALTKVGIVQSQLQEEIDRLQNILDSQMNSRDADTLFIGLMANVYLNLNDTSKAEPYLDYLVTQQQQDGSIQQIQSVDNSNDQQRSSDQQFESTAAAVLGWQTNPDKYYQNAIRGANYLINNVGYRFYNTNIGVILSFDALVNYLTQLNVVNGTADFVLEVNNNEVDRRFFSSSNAQNSGRIEFDTNEVSQNNSIFAPGSSVNVQFLVENYVRNQTEESSMQNITLEDIPLNESGQGGVDLPITNYTSIDMVLNNVSSSNETFQVPYYTELSYDDTNPQNSTRTTLQLIVERAFDLSALGSQQSQGQSFRYNINITNTDVNRSVGLTILEFRPATCLQVNFAQLETLKLNKVISQYQALDNNLIELYFEGIKPNEFIELQLDFLQAYQGECRQRPIDVYEYYRPRDRVYVVFQE